MARNEPKKNSSGGSPVRKQERKKIRRGVFALLALLLFLAGAAALFFWLDRQLFDRNARFTLREVRIVSTGYWGRSKETRADLIRFLKLTPGKDNLFELDLRALRKQAAAVPNIAEASVERLLPDTLIIHIEERVPRAFLGYSRSGLVIDANGMVMAADQCFGVHPKLPVIVGLRGDVQVGRQLAKLAPALDLLMQIQRSMPEFQVLLLSVSQPDRIFASIDYRGNRRYHVTLPSPSPPELLDVLRSAVEEAVRNNDKRNNVNLLFDGYVVLN